MFVCMYVYIYICTYLHIKIVSISHKSHKYNNDCVLMIMKLHIKNTIYK